METINQKIGKELFQSRINNRKDLDCFKRKIAKKYKIAILKNSELLKIYHEMLAKKRARMVKGSPLPFLENVLRKRPVRSLSGIVNVSVLTKPYPCPGKCIFCPSEKGIPKSYLAKEPAVQRAIRNKFRPYKQVEMRLKSLQETGHPIDKVELRIIGGTWSFYPKKYQEWFIGECFRACNEFYSFYGGRSPVKLRPPGGRNLQKLQKKNEKAKCRIVGIAVETRPDFINLKEIKWMRELGITKVELGIQSIYDDVLQKNQRGHLVKDTITATRLLKNAGFKVSYQVMPGLYGASFKRDIQMFKEIFGNPDFKPDYLKIYPLALVKNTKLCRLYKQGKFKPYTQKELTKLLIEIKKQIPYWCRVERIIRDIPSNDIVEGGSSILNLREIVLKEMKKQGLTCCCVRCREVGKYFDSKEKLFLFYDEYEASGGKEIFLSFENKERTKLYALLRLRLPPEPLGHRESQWFFPALTLGNTGVGDIPDPTPTLFALLRLRLCLAESSAKANYAFPALKNAAIIRDLHTYGQMAQINGPQGSVNLAQHKGLGKKLLAKAEKITKENYFSKIAVISSVGTRDYYRKLGYKLKNTYMAKTIK